MSLNFVNSKNCRAIHRTEIHLNSDILSADVLLNGYCIFQKDGNQSISMSNISLKFNAEAILLCLTLDFEKLDLYKRLIQGTYTRNSYKGLI